MCGYQGWFNAEGDGAGRGWVHWGRGRGTPGPGRVAVDLWPDLTGFGPDEKFETGFRHADGRPAEVFSSFKKPTVLIRGRRHEIPLSKLSGEDRKFIEEWDAGQ